MSKLDIGVGDEFPLEEGQREHRRGHRHGRHHFRHHHMHHGHHRHRGHGFGRLATLLIAAGLAALIVEHKLPAEAAYGMIAVGVAAILTMIAAHRRHYRQQVS